MKVCVYKVYDLDKFDKATLKYKEDDFVENNTLKRIIESNNMTSIKEQTRSVEKYVIETSIYEGEEEDAKKFVNDISSSCESHVAEIME